VNLKLDVTLGRKWRKFTLLKDRGPEVREELSQSCALGRRDMLEFVYLSVCCQQSQEHQSVLLIGW
jgi:hypothetical protein